MKGLLVRTASGAVYVLLILLAIYGGRLAKNDEVGSIIFSSIFLIITLIGNYEIVHNLKLRGEQVNEPLSYCLSISLYILMAPITLTMGSFFLIPLFALLPFVVMIVQLWLSHEKPFASIGYTLLPVLWVVVPFTMLSHLHSESPGLVMMLFILIWVNDSFAYITGMLLGKHKMWERHSPGKTWEGTIGGTLFCIAAALIVSPLFNTPFSSWYSWLLVGLICSVIGTLGDLVESMFKRSCGVKDSGKIRPGHGGILDRFDSLLMVTPFVFSLWWVSLWWLLNSKI